MSEALKSAWLPKGTMGFSVSSILDVCDRRRSRFLAALETRAKRTTPFDGMTEERLIKRLQPTATKAIEVELVTDDSTASGS